MIAWKKSNAKHNTRSAFSGFRGVMRFEVFEDAGLRFGRDLCAVNFSHLVYFRLPRGGWKRRLHGDVTRSVARVAVGFHILPARPRHKVRFIKREGANCILCTRMIFHRSRLRHAAQSFGAVIADFQISVNRASGENAQGRKCDQDE